METLDMLLVVIGNYPQKDLKLVFASIGGFKRTACLSALPCTLKDAFLLPFGEWRRHLGLVGGEGAFSRARWRRRGGGGGARARAVDILKTSK
jgi:hypothetical protein